ncbi:ATP-grasp domain-containing protein [Desulfocastanea catecholica]
MEWLVVLDPIEGLVAKTDTSLAIIDQARKSGISVDTATIEQLFFETHVGVIATDASGQKRVRGLDDYALIFMRKEPPYDMAFHYATQLLSLARAPVVNRPSSLRNFNEKLISLAFIHHMPPTLVSSDPDLIGDFLTAQGTSVIKALDSFQGKAVQKIEPSDRATVAAYTEGGKQPVMVQKFLENVYAGDKRVIMLGDRFLGAAMRRPKQGYHANFASSDALRTALTEKEQEIIAEVGPWLLEHGIHFTGLDLIDEQLTEINITCPTGIMQISALEERNLAEEIVDYFIKLA